MSPSPISWPICAPGHVDQFVAGPLALLDQIHHGNKKLPVSGQKTGQLLLVGFSLLAYGVVAFLHGGSPFKVWQPDSFRIRLNRRSTFNYGWDILRSPSFSRTAHAGAEAWSGGWGRHVHIRQELVHDR